ncbi:LamG domain-containing protein [Sorangium cellulosum]|nr:LamG domain-containing protein [Sorangium cellulosum]
MADPKRWLDDDDTSLRTAVLRSAIADIPPPEARQRTLGALGLDDGSCEAHTPSSSVEPAPRGHQHSRKRVAAVVITVAAALAGSVYFATRPLAPAPGLSSAHGPMASIEDVAAPMAESVPPTVVPLSRAEFTRAPRTVPGDRSSAGLPPMAGLKLWLRSDKGVFARAGNVYEWQDQSENGLHATMPVASRQPELVSGTLNGKPVVRFHGAQSLWLSAPVQPSSFAVFVVGKNNKASEKFSIILGPGGNWPNNQLRWENGHEVLFVGTSNDLQATTAKIGDTRVYHLLSARYDGETLSVYRDGSFISRHNVSPGGPWTLAQVGAWYSKEFMEGDLAELLVYDQAISDESRTSIEGHLLDKYDIP